MLQCRYCRVILVVIFSNLLHSRERSFQIWGVYYLFKNSNNTNNEESNVKNKFLYKIKTFKRAVLNIFFSFSLCFECNNCLSNINPRMYFQKVKSH